MMRTLVWPGLVALASLASSGLEAADCNGNGADDGVDLASGASRDCNSNAVPDECDQTQGRLTFELGKGILGGGYSDSLVVTDLDGDGDPDVASAGTDISVLLNNGYGEFGEPARYPVGEEPWYMSGADLDGDGDTDLVAGSTWRQDVPVLLNQGNGSFSLSMPLLIPMETRLHPDAADLDLDGDLDLLARSRPLLEGRPLPELWIIKNRGDGTFSPAERIAVMEVGLGFLAIADLDGDRDPDLAAAGATTSILLNDGAGRFARSEDHSTGQSREILAADFDRDGDPDLAAFQLQAGTVSVLRNRGDGSFGEPAYLEAGAPGETMAAGDLDRDGDIDLVAGWGDWPGSGKPSGMAIFLNDGEGNFGSLSVYPSAENPQKILIEDLDGDGGPDIAASFYSSGKILVLHNRGGQGFESVGLFELGRGGAISLAAEDLDGDRDRDLLAGHLNGRGVTLLTNSSGEGFTLGCDPFLRGDVNADGAVSIADMVMLRRYFFAPGAMQVTCDDAADASDDETLNLCDVFTVMEALFLHPDWSFALPAPSVGPGLDLTISTQSPIPEWCGGTTPSGRRLSCAGYRPEFPIRTADRIRIGDVIGSPGEAVRFPVYVSSSVPAAAVQLVVEHDPRLLEITSESLSYEGTFFDFSLGRRPDTHGLSALTLHPRSGVFTAIIAGDAVRDGYEVAPGRDVLIAWISARVSRGVSPGSTIRLTPTNGADGQGTGPYRLRNEISYRGEARLVSVLPELEGGVLTIVADQALFSRGDSNGDGRVDVSDAVNTLHALFIESRPIACRDAVDANDDGRLDMTDAIFTLSFMFLGGEEPPPPFPGRGLDPTPDGLSCGPDGT